MQPVTFTPKLERVAHRVPALERGQQRRMRVDGAAAERVDERLRQDRAETGDRDEVDVVPLQARRSPRACTRRGRTRARSRALDELDRDTVRARDVESRRTDGRRRPPTTGKPRSTSARRIVPLPDARTPTRMPRTVADLPANCAFATHRARRCGVHPRSESRQMFHFLTHRLDGEALAANRPTPGEWTMMLGGVVAVAAFLPRGRVGDDGLGRGCRSRSSA